MTIAECVKDPSRNERLCAEFDGIVIDATRQDLQSEDIDSLLKTYESSGVSKKLAAMFGGELINSTEKRAVMHMALRSAENDGYKVAGVDVSSEVHKVLNGMKVFVDKVRSGSFKGYTGKALTDVVCIGIGGSYLGVEFVFEGLRTNSEAAKQAAGRRTRFLANVDPIDIARATEGLNPETTLVVIISKTFTTAETMLNAKCIKDWILKGFNGDASAIGKHMCAVSTNIKATSEFGISSENVFGFWDWVGGRFSVCSAVGVLPLALQYSFEIVEEFLAGARSIDEHCIAKKDDPLSSLPGLMALVSHFNATEKDYNSVAVLPYCQALLRFPAHIQQLTMESNGKRVTIEGQQLASGKHTGEIYFGEPGTNGQHSFYQLIHQGRVIPCEFIGFTKSQNPVQLDSEQVSNHDELMSNFFAQPDALAYGKDEATLKAENCSAELIPHKTFPGNRPSVCVLFNGECDARRIGQLLAIYEHRTAIQGFLFDVNSFDQWGVELGKVLAKDIRSRVSAARAKGLSEATTDKLPINTQKMLTQYLKN